MYTKKGNRRFTNQAVIGTAFAFIVILAATCHSHDRFWAGQTYTIRYDNLPLHSILDSLRSYDYLVYLKGDSKELAEKFVPVTYHASHVNLQVLLDTIFIRQPKLDYTFYIISTEIIIQKR